MTELITEVKNKLQKRPDPQEFALWIRPRLNAAIETVEDPEEANGLRGIADMTRVYLRQSLPMVMRDRSECLKQMYPVEEAYVRICGKAGLLYKPENSLPGSNFHNAGFMSSRDATTCIRIGELIEDGELETYFEHTKENQRHITVGGAESAWRLLYGEIPEKENHLKNILKILGHDDSDEETIRRLNIYVATRDLQKNFYSSLSKKELMECKEEIDEWLKDA